MPACSLLSKTDLFLVMFRSPIKLGSKLLMKFFILHKYLNGPKMSVLKSSAVILAALALGGRRRSRCSLPRG